MLARERVPSWGPLVDRCVFNYALQMYNDASIRSLICAVCGCICLDTGGLRSSNELVTGGWLLSLPKGALRKNMSFATFSERYCKHESPRATEHCLHPALIAEAMRNDAKETAEIRSFQDGELFCCPEDHWCEKGCAQHRLLCWPKSIPLSPFRNPR